MQLVVLGDGTLRSEMEQRVATLGLQDYVVFEGLCEPAEVAELMRHCSMFVAAVENGA